MILFTLFIEFFKIGLFTIGGGYAMIPLVKETVLNYAWLDEGQFYDFLGICESTPGPIAINMATFVGSSQGATLNSTWGSLLGSFCATLGVVLPSFLIILLIAAVLRNLTDNKYFKGFIDGVKPVVIGLITSTGVVLLMKCIGYVSIKEFSINTVSVISFTIITVVYFASKKFLNKKMPAIPIILLSAASGLVFSLLLK